MRIIFIIRSFIYCSTYNNDGVSSCGFYLRLKIDRIFDLEITMIIDINLYGFSYIQKDD